MKFFPRIVQSALLVTTPTLNGYPTNEFSRFVIQQVNHQPIQIPDLRTLSYDEVVDLLRKIESDSFDERYSEDELDQINQFVSLLAMEGATDDEKPEIERAVACLFRKDDIQYAVFNPSVGYTVKPAIYIEGTHDFVLCKSWFKKQWDQTRSFVKEHKKSIIIGAIVVVAVAVVVVGAVAISAAASAAAAAAGGTAAGAQDSTDAPTGTSSSAHERKDISEPKETSSNQLLASSLQTQVSEFKETIAQEQFAAVSESNSISMEENGRIIGSLFAHKAVDSLTNSFAQNPTFATELKDFGFNSQYPIPGWLQTSPDSSIIMLHPSTDLAFSTDYATSYTGNFNDLNAMSYQVRGDVGLGSQCYAQAVQDFGSAISLDPSNPILYLKRGIANFELGNYEQSIADYNQFVEKKAEPFSITDFSLGFAKGGSKGAYESGKGALLFLSDFVRHPVQTSKQVVDSLSQLAILVKNDEFNVVIETLCPELHQLVTQWDSLSSETKGELAGYAVGKLGTDLLAPGAIAKVASKSMNSAKELVAVCKNLQIAQKTLVLETAAGIGIPTKVEEIVEMGKKTAILGEELGFTTKEIAALKESGELKEVVGKGRDFFAGNPELQASYDLFKKAKETLQPYVKKPMPEIEIRNLIHQNNIPTFQKPLGIPENYLVRITEKGAGMEYFDPIQPKTSIRVMPGTPHSPNPRQQVPYVIQTKRGKTLDKFGKEVASDAPEAHIPLYEFVYKD